MILTRLIRSQEEIVAALKFDETRIEVEETVGLIGQLCFANSFRKGFWDQCIATYDRNGVVEQVIDPSRRNAPEMIALMHSELSEALEGLRKKAKDDHLPHRDSVEVELADCIIRIMDFAEAHGLDIGGAIVEKLLFNATRPHKHGKQF